MSELEQIKTELQVLANGPQKELGLRAIAIAEERQAAFNMMMDSRVDVSTAEAAKFRAALEEIVEVAGRSDAHPDVDILSIAKKALTDSDG